MGAVQVLKTSLQVIGRAKTYLTSKRPLELSTWFRMGPLTFLRDLERVLKSHYQTDCSISHSTSELEAVSFLLPSCGVPYIPLLLPYSFLFTLAGNHLSNHLLSHLLSHLTIYLRPSPGITMRPPPLELLTSTAATSPALASPPTAINHLTDHLPRSPRRLPPPSTPTSNHLDPT